MQGFKVPELLVPANNLNVLKYAVQYGADAVYVGGKKFNLRSVRGNFTVEQLKEGVEYAHKNGVKLYLTLNSVLFEDETEELKNYIGQIRDIGIDAVIIADLGIFSIIQKHWPGVKINISTQVNTTNSRAVNFWKQLGASRVNIAREVKFKDLKEIKEKTGIEIEVFTHGALCISYSGRCMLSKYMVGRDANRGKCAHSCRWKYYLMEEERPNLFFQIEQNKKGTYIYNSRDLCLLPRLEEVARIKIDSLKIEGRMKTENYVALTTWVYRRALDYLKAGNFNQEKINFLMEELEKCSHRNFTLGFMFLEDHKELEDNENVGYIKKYSFVAVYKSFSEHFNGPVLRIKNQLKVGETLDILQPGKDPVKVNIGEMVKEENNEPVEIANPNDRIIIPGIGNLDKFSIFRIKT